VTAETPDSLIHTAPSERRPAIWPWLVMPLITLLVFYWLYSLDQGSGQVGGGWKARGPASEASASAE
jgi:hypothetical protein